MKTLIVGNSLSVVSVIERLRHNDPNGVIALFATESVLPYDRSLLPSLVVGAIKEAKVHPVSDDFFKQHHVEFITGEKLARISVKRKHLTTEKKTQISYDKLVLVDTGELIFPAVKGHHKKGVFDAWRLTSFKALAKYLPFVDNIVIVVSNFQGLNMACALSQQKKEVMVVAHGESFLADYFDEETGSLLKQILEAKGMRVVLDNPLQEIIGDTEVKAVKFKSGKAMAAEMVIFDEARADLRMLSEQELSPKDEMIAEEYFKAPAMPMLPLDFGFGVLDGFCAGMTKLPDGGSEYLAFDGPQNIFKKIFTHSDHLVGAVLFNAPQDKGRLWQLIQGKDNIAGREQEILSA